MRVLVQARLEGVEAREGQIRVAPLEDPQGIEVVVLQPLHQFRLEGLAAARGAEGAVGQVPPGAPRDLAHLRGRQPPEAGAVVFPVGGEGDVIHVEVQPHPHGVGGHEVVHVAALVELHLAVAGAGREGAEHHRRAAALAADQLGDGVDLLRREGDDGRAAGQARELLLPGEGQFRQARPGGGVDVGDEALHQRQDGGGADEQRLLPAAHVEQPVGEDVAPVHVGAKLDLVDGHEGDVEVPGHRLDGADPVARPVRLYFFLARHERNLFRADLGDDAQVDLPREQPQGQPDHPGRMRQHPLDGEVRLAGVGGPEHRRHAAGAGVTVQGALGGAEEGVDDRGSFGRATVGEGPVPRKDPCGRPRTPLIWATVTAPANLRHDDGVSLDLQVHRWLLRRHVGAECIRHRRERPAPGRPVLDHLRGGEGVAAAGRAGGEWLGRRRGGAEEGEESEGAHPMIAPGRGKDCLAPFHRRVRHPPPLAGANRGRAPGLDPSRCPGSPHVFSDEVGRSAAVFAGDARRSGDALLSGTSRRPRRDRI